MPFIVFEGLDGSGKSTLMGKLLKELEKRSIKYATTREPGGTPLGDHLRELIVAKAETAPTPRAELLLYEASRAQLVETWIKPKLKENYWVISDRFSASSIAFQCGGRNISQEDVQWLNHYATEGLEPNLYILLDISVDVSKKRREKRVKESGVEQDRIESEKDDFHQRVRDSFLSQAQGDPKRWLVVSAESTSEEMLAHVLQRFKGMGWLD
ncbi:MAG: dTMP kinase [Bdellovibrionales bacterium]|nr:dTMP kinase [Bdellovibrionales bacterium]